jgi:hypothetical protein
MLLNAYIICLRFTRGSTIKRTIQVGGSVSERVQSGGVSPRIVQLGGATSDGKIHFPLMTKGEIFIRCRIEMLGERAQRHVDSMLVLPSMPKGEIVKQLLRLMDNWYGLLVFIDVNHWRVILYIDVNP